MRIENLSIRTVTVVIFMMIAVVAIVLSLLAGNYFRQAALDAQMKSLSRVIEVASQEMLKAVRGHTFDLGMKLGNSPELIAAIRNVDQVTGSREDLVKILDDPFINGFVGFAKINMVKLRLYDLELNMIAASSRGTGGLGNKPAPYIEQKIRHRRGVDRLKAVDGLWFSNNGPLYSTVVPVGGLRLTAYLEVIVDPVFNLLDIDNITRTPVSVFSVSGEPLNDNVHQGKQGFLPVEFELLTSDGKPAFRIVGYENVDTLNRDMEKTKIVTISGFLLLSMMTLLFALWLFNRFLFLPLSRMMRDMKQMAQGDLELEVNKTGLREFYTLAETFNTMADKVRLRTQDLSDSLNRLLQLLDLDDSAILYFGKDNEVVYFNRASTDLFGYSSEEMGDMDTTDLFVDDIAGIVNESVLEKLHTELQCLRNNGDVVKCRAVLHVLDVMGEKGIAIALSSQKPATGEISAMEVMAKMGLSDQRMDVVEQSLNSILEIARHNPGVANARSGLVSLGLKYSEAPDDKLALRTHCVELMNSALACWERDAGRGKLELAEESGIWQVYIDKSTPTTRTLDKYLNIDSCPKNPRYQRVIDTAEFVLRNTGPANRSAQKKLQALLDDFRMRISGMKSSPRPGKT